MRVKSDLGYLARTAVALTIATAALFPVACGRGAGEATPPTTRSGSTDRVTTTSTTTTKPPSTGPTSSTVTTPAAPSTDPPPAESQPAEPQPAATVPPPDPTICVAPVELRDKVSALVMVSADPTRPDRARATLEAYPYLNGLFLGGRDDTILRDQRFVDLVSRGRWFIAIDDEGGRVQRLKVIAGDMASAAVQSASPTPVIQAFARGRGLAMRAHGINVDFAPVVDLAEPDSNLVIGDRSYSPDAAITADRAGAFASGLRSAGILPTLKHFPGHGASIADSHRGTVTTPDLETLRQTHLVPYKVLTRNAPVAVMVGHLDVPGLTEPGTPSSLSPRVYDLLRTEIGFDGVVFTDDLSGMKAVTGRFSTAQAVERAIAAGADVALLATYDPAPHINTLVAAVNAGRISMERIDSAVAHVLAAKNSIGLGHCV